MSHEEAINMTIGELIASPDEAAKQLLAEEGIDPTQGYITVDLVRNKRMTVRKWRLIRRLRVRYRDQLMALYR
jgi:hypothetical protein